MAKDIDLQEFSTFTDRQIDRSGSRPPASLSSTAAAAPTAADAAPTAEKEIWLPVEPQLCKAICAYYGVDPRTVQRGKKRIHSALPWLSDTQLRLPDDRYTPLCIKLLGDYWQSGLKIEDWKAQMWERYPDEAQAFLEAQHSVAEMSAVQSDVLPPLPETADFGSDVVPYVRSIDLNQLLGSRPSPEGVPIAPEQSLVYQTLDDLIASIRGRNQQTDSQLSNVRQATQDTADALKTLKDIRVVEETLAEADRHQLLRKEVYRRRTEELELQDLQAAGAPVGKSQPVSPQPQSA